MSGIRKWLGSINLVYRTNPHYASQNWKKKKKSLPVQLEDFVSGLIPVACEGLPRSLPWASLLPAWCLSSWWDGSPPALEEFSAIITAFTVIYCHLNPNVSQPCLMAVGSIDCLSEWHCVTLITSLQFEWHVMRAIPLCQLCIPTY